MYSFLIGKESIHEWRYPSTTPLRLSILYTLTVELYDVNSIPFIQSESVMAGSDWQEECPSESVT